MSREQVHIPLAEVIDWPDMDERGLWNFPEPATWIPWLATLKLNYGKMASTQLHPIERGQRNRATIDREQFEAAQQRAFNYLPYILHLNFLHDCGLFKGLSRTGWQGRRGFDRALFRPQDGQSAPGSLRFAAAVGANYTRVDGGYRRAGGRGNKLLVERTTGAVRLS